MNTYLSLSSFFNFFASIVLVTLIASSSEKNQVQRRYLYFLLTITAWSGTYFLWRMSEETEVAEFYCQLLIAASTFTPITFYHFVLRFVGVSRPIELVLGYGISSLLVALVPFGLIVEGVSTKFGHQYWPDAGLVMPIYLLFYSYYLAASVWQLWQGARRNLGKRASNYMFVLISGCIGYAGGVTNFPLWYDIPIQPFGNGLVAVYIVVVGYGLHGRKIPGISLNFYKALAGLFINLSVTLFFILFYVLYIGANGIEMPAHELWFRGLGVFMLSALVFWGVPRLKMATERIVDGVFRKEHVSALVELNELTDKVSDVADIDLLSMEVADCIQDILDVEGVAVFRKEVHAGQYKCEYATESMSEVADSYELDATNPIIDTLSLRPEAIVLDQIYDDTSAPLYEELLKLRRKLHASVIVPIAAGHDIYGLIVLGQPRQVKVWVPEEISGLYNLGTQLGINLRVRDFERRSSEVDKLVALGTMAAGLSHEIRNPLVSVQTLASLLKRGKSFDVMPEDFRNVLIRDIRRIENIVDGVAAYSKNQKADKTVNNISEIVEASMEIYKSAAEKAGIRYQLGESFRAETMVYSNFEQLVQVFNNLIENAIHALEGRDDGEILMELSMTSTNATGRNRWVEVSIADNGEGVPASIFNRIFDPFTTSKDTGSREEKYGMGLGLAISKRIIENHGGAITVANIPNGGAKFVVSLKVFESK